MAAPQPQEARGVRAREAAIMPGGVETSTDHRQQLYSTQLGIDEVKLQKTQMGD